MEFIVAEIKTVRELAEARGRHRVTCDLRQMMQSFSDKLAKLIQKHTLSADEVGIVMQELNDSPYTDANTANLISLLDGKLLQSMNQDVTDNAACAGTGGQLDPACKCKLQTWWNYFTKPDWLIFNDPAKSFH